MKFGTMPFFVAQRRAKRVLGQTDDPNPVPAGRHRPRYHSVPYIRFVVFHLVDLQLPQILRPKHVLGVMGLLIADVLIDPFLLARTYGKRAVARLPCKICEAPMLAMNPAGPVGLYFGQHILEGVIPAQLHQQMDMVFGAIDDEREAIHTLHCAREVAMHFGTEVGREKSHRGLGGKDDNDR